MAFCAILEGGLSLLAHCPLKILQALWADPCWYSALVARGRLAGAQDTIGLASAGGRKKTPPRQRQYLGPILTSGTKERESPDTCLSVFTGVVMLFTVGKVEDQR